MSSVDGKVVLVTGGARGMGASHAGHLTALGARVVIGDVRDADGAAVAANLGPACRYVHHDVTSETDWAAAVLPGRHVDTLQSPRVLRGASSRGGLPR
jgi:3alpha(or 20beta)-hydroxysteroid dehydrogenase